MNKHQWRILRLTIIGLACFGIGVIFMTTIARLEKPPTEARLMETGKIYNWGYEAGYGEGKRDERSKYTPSSLTIGTSNTITENATNIVFMPMNTITFGSGNMTLHSLYIMQTDNDTKSIDIKGLIDTEGNSFIRVTEVKENDAE